MGIMEGLGKRRDSGVHRCPLAGVGRKDYIDLSSVIIPLFN
jgi:hypothetical protein